MPLRLLPSSNSLVAPVRPCETVDSEASLLAVRVLRFYPEEKDAVSLKKTRFVYEIETCNQVTGDVYHAHRRFREFKRLRDGLLADCRDCLQCRRFVETLKAAKLPTRGFIVLDIEKYGSTRALQLTHFLKDLIEIVARHARHCCRNGDDVDKSVGSFLGLSSLKEAEDVVRAMAALVGPCKTRQDRIDFRAASMPNFRSSMVSADQGALDRFRRRGYSALELRSSMPSISSYLY